MLNLHSILGAAEPAAAEPGFLDVWLPRLADYGVKIVGVIALFIVGKFVAGKVAKVVEKRLDKRDFDKTLTRFFAGLVRTLILLMVVLACLSIFGIETTSVAAVIGASALAIGLAFQGSLSNFAAGIMLIIFRPFNVGDLVKVGGEVGIIANIGMFTTTMDTPDNIRIIVPNSSVFGSTITNMSHHALRRVDIDVGCDYTADINACRKAMEEAITKVASRDPEGPHQVFLSSLGGSSVDWQVRVFGHPDKYWDIYQETIQAVKESLDAAGIGIPFPQMDVHVDGKLG